MPTPDISFASASSTSHSTCPSEIDILQSQERLQDEPFCDDAETSEERVSREDVNDDILSRVKVNLSQAECDDHTAESGASRSTTVEAETRSEEQYAYSIPQDLGFALTPETSYTFSDVTAARKRPSYPSSFLRPGSKFTGTQTDKQVYSVEVQVKQVDMQQSTMCGYLTINGLTPEFPTLTTFFDGEIIGPHHSFITKHSNWGASEKSDLAHWDRFPAFRPLAKQAKNPDFHPNNISQRENIFMRWKERFLVPNHKVSEIQGASYEGFYYICFNQIQGSISGVYFHAKSDRYQSLDLKHVPDRGCLAALGWA